MLQIANIGNAAATSATATITFPDGSISSLLVTDLAPGEVISGTLEWLVPAVPVRGATEAESAYYDRLAAADGAALTSNVTLVWQDAQGHAFGPVAQPATTTQQAPILTLAATAPAMVRPGDLVTIDLAIQNVGSDASGPLRVRVTNPDGTLSSVTALALPVGQTSVLHTVWSVPTFVKYSSESDADYQACLAARLQPQVFAAVLDWEDAVSNPYGTISGQASSTSVAPLPILALELAGPEQVRAGETTTYTVTLRNIGQSDAFSMSLALVMPDNTIQALDPGDVLAPGAERQFSVPFVVAGVGAAGPYRAHVQATWQDSLHNGFGRISATHASTLAHDPPVAVNDSYTLDAGQTLIVSPTGVLANDLAADGLALTAVLVEEPAHGALALAETGGFYYTPDAGFTGTDSFRYRANDGFTMSTTATVPLIVRPVDRPPQVDAGADQTNTVSMQVQLQGAASDDGLPAGSQVTVGWSKVSGPGEVVFTDPAAAQTTASFSDYGIYVLRLTATDGELSASDEVIITIATVAMLPDLRIDPVDKSAVVADGRTLQVTGIVSTTVHNAGPSATPIGFLVTFFEDHNANGTFEPVTDQVLATATLPSLSAGASAQVSAPVSGTVLFADNLIYAFVDSANAIVESDETNNISNSSGGCDPRVPGSVFAPRLEWQWSGSTVLPSSNQVMMAPAVIDLNGDHFPDVVFSTFTGGNYTTDGHLRAISGRDGSELFTITDPVYDVRGAASVAVGDIDLDGLPEILAGDESGNRIIAFEHNGTFKWRSPNIAGGVNWGGASIADLNRDGTPDIVVGADVLNLRVVPAVCPSPMHTRCRRRPPSASQGRMFYA